MRCLGSASSRLLTRAPHLPLFTRRAHWLAAMALTADLGFSGAVAHIAATSRKASLCGNVGCSALIYGIHIRQGCEHSTTHGQHNTSEDHGNEADRKSVTDALQYTPASPSSTVQADRGHPSTTL